MSQNVVIYTQPMSESGGLAHARRFRVYTQRDLESIPQLQRLSSEVRFDMRVVSTVLPFRVNEYVTNDLIDWANVPEDPIFQLTFPQRDMLSPEDFDCVAKLLRHGADKNDVFAAVHSVQGRLNPHPAGQMALNMPLDANGRRIDGLQHKYRETALFFPSQGQTCHSYCTFCFRWAQFVGDKEMRIASSEATQLQSYLRSHREISDLLVTGGDPMVMKTRHLAEYLEPLLHPEFEHVQTIRIGTKALTFWPYRFVTDKDADDLLALFARLVNAGKHLAVMSHYNHWRELDTDIARQAIARIRSTGAVIRSQGPLLAHINDDPNIWARLWKTQVQLGIIPYYMFVERDTGARRYFEVPLVRAWEIYRGAMQQLSGLGRTARGPSMSADPGKVEVQGIAEINGEKVFVLRLIQGRDPNWVQKPFFAKYDEQATWLNHLKPAFGETEFFFEKAFREMQSQRGTMDSVFQRD